MNLRSHSKYAGEEVKELTEEERRVLIRLIQHLSKIYNPDLKDAIEGWRKRNDWLQNHRRIQ